MYNPTCLVTGKKDNLRMYPLRNDNDEMIGWVFLHESVDFTKINAKIKWDFSAVVTKEE